MNFNNYRVCTQNTVDAARLAQDNQRIRTVAMHKANTVHVVQHLFLHGMQDMMQGNRSLTRRIVEVTADALDYPLFHTKEARFARIRTNLSPRDPTIAPTFHRLVVMNILVARRRLTGNSLEYGLAAHFAATLPQPPHFNVPKPPTCYVYPELNETSSDESSNKDE